MLCALNGDKLFRLLRVVKIAKAAWGAYIGVPVSYIVRQVAISGRAAVGSARLYSHTRCTG